MIRNMYCSIIFWLGHLSDQTGICIGQSQKCWKMSDTLTVISCSAYHGLAHCKCKLLFDQSVGQSQWLSLHHLEASTIQAKDYKGKSFHGFLTWIMSTKNTRLANKLVKATTFLVYDNLLYSCSVTIVPSLLTTQYCSRVAGKNLLTPSFFATARKVCVCLSVCFNAYVYTYQYL